MQPNNLILESCVESLQEAIDAEDRGAHQLELCSRLDLDGLSPDLKLIVSVIKTINKPVKVMVRCREGDFIYSNEEMRQMIEYAKEAYKIGIRDFVFGALTTDGGIDIKAVDMISAAIPKATFTFHKAIDLCKEPQNATNAMSSFPNFKFILTSGGKNTAIEGANVIKQMMGNAPEHIQIIPAGKITALNLPKVHNLIGAKYYHGRSIV